MSLGTMLFIVNPAANNGAGAEAARRLESLVGLHAASFASARILRTSCPGEATRIAADSSADTIVVAGGDGVIHEAVCGIMGRPRADRPRLGILPCGNGNDFARTLKMPVGIEAAFPRLLAGASRSIDIGCCNGVHFMQTLSFGLDAAIAIGTHERRERTGQTGTALFFAEGVDHLLHHRVAYPFEASFDGGPSMRGSMMMFAIQNGRSYGGGFDIAPAADPSDGLLDICYAHAPIPLLPAALLFLRAKEGRHLSSKRMSFARASHIDLSFESAPPAQIDGEPIEASHFQASVERCALDAIFGEERSA